MSKRQRARVPKFALGKDDRDEVACREGRYARIVATRCRRRSSLEDATI
jgi:hypothetical protein